MLYIHQLKQWPQFQWDNDSVVVLLGEARNLQGRLMGKMESLGFNLQSEAMLNTITLDVLKSSEIEGEYLDINQVRSSVARRLGIDIAGSVETDRTVDGVVEMMLDATQNCNKALTAERLFAWHAALFPTGRRGMFKITVADWRKDTKGPMQVVSGALGKEKVHFEAPAVDRVQEEMTVFIEWLNGHKDMDLVLKAAIAHLWFVTIHPFEDGNGRMARAITDMLLAQSDKSTRRFYSMSAQIRIERKQYYAVLEKTQKGNLNITTWLTWFLNCLIHALQSSEKILANVLLKANFWNSHASTLMNDRQQKMLTLLLDGFKGKLTSSKWAQIAKCSKDTAIRDINDLITKHILKKEQASGRSTHYELIQPPPHHE